MESNNVTPPDNGEDVTVKTVTGHDDPESDYLSILTNEGMGFGLEKKYNVVPKEGDVITLYTVQGSTIRGMDINKEKIYYKTDEQLQEERKEWLANNEKEKEERFLKEKDKLDADYNALPEFFQKRIDKFRANNPTFRKDFESYELFTCTEAVKIATALANDEEIAKHPDVVGWIEKPVPERIKLWSNLAWPEQKLIIPTLDEGHSGNTFGMACQLAFHFTSNPENVVKLHGALAPLVGSEEYGCIPKKSTEPNPPTE